MTKVAVTGGSGLLGRAVIQHLVQHGYSVRSLDRKAPPDEHAAEGIETMVVDLADVASVQHAFEGCDAVIHLAAFPTPLHNPWPEVYANNTITSYNVLHTAATLGIRKICLASSINAIGAAYSQTPHFDYFPVDERHPTHNEDAYSLSKWVLEAQADSIARRWSGLTIASLRFHGIVSLEQIKTWASRDEKRTARNLWGYVEPAASADACRLAIEADFPGHEVFFIVAPNTYRTELSVELAQRFYPDVPITCDLTEHKGFFDTRKANHMLGWNHAG